MDIVAATRDYEAWLGRHGRIVAADLELKHRRMRESSFAFFRSTFYRWAQLWPEKCQPLAAGTLVLSSGDLHIENFGTWRDLEGRLAWGVNDVDEAHPLPWTHDLVRLLASVHLAKLEGSVSIRRREAAELVLGAYRLALQAGGRPIVLADENTSLRRMVNERLKVPENFWKRLDALPSLSAARVPAEVRDLLERALPYGVEEGRFVHRVSGLGNLGRERYCLLGRWQGGRVAREVKAMAPSAWLWARGSRVKTPPLHVQEIIDRAVRCHDPMLVLHGRWLVRRLSPDNSRIDLAALPSALDAGELLAAMGAETANLHLGTPKARAAIEAEMAELPHDWLHDAAKTMLDQVCADWREWQQHGTI